MSGHMVCRNCHDIERKHGMMMPLMPGEHRDACPEYITAFDRDLERRIAELEARLARKEGEST